MLFVTAKSESDDYYAFKFDGDASVEELKARIDSYAKEIGDYDYEDDHSYINIQDIYDLDDLPELLDYEPLYNTEENECDY